MKLAGKTDVGRVRRENQDDFRAGELPGGAAWALVCDGMGGARGGREASHGACDVIERCFQEQYSRCAHGGEEAFLTQALESANHYVFQKSSREEALADFLRRDLSGYREIVFCGFGEPMYRWDDIAWIIDALKARCPNLPRCASTPTATRRCSWAGM